MANILAFAGSNSSTSINYELVKYTVSFMGNHQIQLMNMANFPFPMFSEDYEKKNGYSNSLVELKNDIAKADGLVLSVNEHNSYPSAFFKNVLDWLSRIDINFLENTKVLLMSTSPGKGGAKRALEVTSKTLPRFGADSLVSFSLPSFSDNFDADKGILDSDLSKNHEIAIKSFLASF
jgi:NAD(P)H-dependent FMN reductase